MQAAPGKGIVTALTLQSDDMDEIDFVGSLVKLLARQSANKKSGMGRQPQRPGRVKLLPHRSEQPQERQDSSAGLQP